MIVGFHWKNGWYFKRESDGSVRIRKVEHASGLDMVDAIIPPAEWASIVCSVSRDGETGERWNQAQDFHGREP